MEKVTIFNDLRKKEKTNKIFVYLLLSATVIISIYCMYSVKSIAVSSKNKFYLIDKGQKISISRTQNINEANDILTKGHIKLFHELFFTYNYDMSFIKNNIEKKALYMIDNSGHRLYNGLINSNYYDDIVLNKIMVLVETEKIDVDYSSYPYKFTFFGRQKIINGKSDSYRKLITKGNIKNTLVTPNNLNGLQIIDYDVVDNKDI